MLLLSLNHPTFNDFCLFVFFLCFFNKSIYVASSFVFWCILFFLSQVIPLRASNLLQTELKKIVFVGNKEYMQKEVETFSFLETQLEIRNSFLFYANWFRMFMSVVSMRYISQVKGRVPMLCLLREPLPITATCRSVIDALHVSVSVVSETSHKHVKFFRKRLESLSGICCCNFKGNTSFTVALKPWPVGQVGSCTTTNSIENLTVEAAVYWEPSRRSSVEKKTSEVNSILCSILVSFSLCSGISFVTLKMSMFYL